MCVMSAVFTGAQQVPLSNWDNTNWGQFKDILDAIKKLDMDLKQKDCEDPNKAIWMKSVEERLRNLEASKNANS